MSKQVAMKPVKKVFNQNVKWAHKGFDVFQYSMDQEVEITDPDLLRVGESEGWFKGSERTPSTAKNKGDAPSNKGK